MVLKKTRHMGIDNPYTIITTIAEADRMRCRLAIATAKNIIAIDGDEPDLRELCENRIQEAEKLIREIDAFLESNWLKSMPRYKSADENGKETEDEC